MLTIYKETIVSSLGIWELLLLFFFSDRDSDWEWNVSDNEKAGRQSICEIQGLSFWIETKLIVALNNPSISEMFLKFKKKKNHGPFVKMIE